MAAQKLKHLMIQDISMISWHNGKLQIKHLKKSDEKQLMWTETISYSRIFFLDCQISTYEIHSETDLMIKGLVLMTVLIFRSIYFYFYLDFAVHFFTICHR